MRIPNHKFLFCFGVCMNVYVKWVNTCKALRMMSGAFISAVGMLAVTINL